MFELTYGCNFRCVHCYNPTHQAKPQELSTQEISGILDQIARLGVVFLRLTGGELFFRKDIFQIIERARASGLIVEILTNASFINPAIVQQLESLNVKAVNVSIYGATEGTFENVTRVKGSFKRFQEGLRALEKSSLLTHVRMPLMTINVHEAEMARTLVESMGFKFEFTCEIEPGQEGNYETLRYRLSPEEQIAIAKKLDPGSLKVPVVLEENDIFISCSCGKDQFAITPYGEMNLCVSFPIPKYDLRKGSVADGWAVLQKTASNAHLDKDDPCPPCPLKHFCHQGRADAYLETGNMSACLPYFRQWAELQENEYLAFQNT